MTARLMTALITPYKEDLSVDLDALEKIVAHCLKQKAEGFVVCGTTGEACFLSEEEKLAILQTVIKCAEGKEIWMGIGTNCTKTTLDLLKSVDAYPISGVMAVAPYYVRPSQKGLIEHFAAIAEATDKKVMLYNVPKRCQVEIEAETVIYLANNYPNIQAYKHASSDLSHIGDILAATENLLIYSGEDELVFEGLQSGMCGIISVISHLYGEEISRLILENQCGINNSELVSKLKHAASCIMKQGNPSGIKAACSLSGLCANTLRLPLVPIDDEGKNQIEERLRIDKKINAPVIR